MNWEFILRMFIAGIFGGVIGIERSRRAKDAGVRTHFLVGLGSALFMVISQYAFSGNFDSSRVAAQVVSGIGFIGAGVIIFQRNVVRGITTAAGLWATAAIGLACGAGLYREGLAATIMVLIVLEAMQYIFPGHSENIINLTISSDSKERLTEAIQALGKEKIYVDSCQISYGGERYTASMELKVRHRERIDGILHIFNETENVRLDNIE